MRFHINWKKTPKGNGIAEGSILRVNAPGASHISGSIYKNGFPVLAIFGMGSRASIKVKRKNKSLRGRAILKLRAYDKYGKGFGIDDIFEVI